MYLKAVEEVRVEDAFAGIFLDKTECEADGQLGDKVHSERERVRVGLWYLTGPRTETEIRVCLVMVYKRK